MSPETNLPLKNSLQRHTLIEKTFSDVQSQVFYFHFHTTC